MAYPPGEYVPNFVLVTGPPLPTYAEKLAAYQRDQELRFTSSSRAEYEQRKAAEVAARRQQKAP